MANTFDLSIGALMGMSLVITNWFGLNTLMPAGLAALLAIAACVGVGAVSGFVVVKLHVNSFVATLGVGEFVAGPVILVSDNRQLTGAFSDLYKDFGRKQFGGIPVVVVYLAVLAAIVWFVLDQTPLGRRLRATGSNAEAARLAGLRTDRLVWGSLVASAALSGFAGVLFSMKTGTFSTSTGPGYLFRPWPPSSSVRRSSPDGPMCGALSSPTTRWHWDQRSSARRRAGNGVDRSGVRRVRAAPRRRPGQPAGHHPGA